MSADSAKPKPNQTKARDKPEETTRVLAVHQLLPKPCRTLMTPKSFSIKQQMDISRPERTSDRSFQQRRTSSYINKSGTILETDFCNDGQNQTFRLRLEIQKQLNHHHSSPNGNCCRRTMYRTSSRYTTTLIHSSRSSTTHTLISTS